MSSFLCRLVGLLLLASISTWPVFAGGIVRNCTEADLRTALAGGGTVTFACDGTIVLAAPIDVTAPTVVDGAGRDVTISGNGQVRVFNVDGASLELRQITVADGKSGVTGWGGGISGSYSELVLRECTFRNNEAGSGGAIALYAFGGVSRLEATGCAFVENTGGRLGGALLLTGIGVSAGLTNCTFYQNSSVNGGGAVAVYLETASFFHCTFVANGGPDAITGSSPEFNDCLIAGSTGNNFGNFVVRGVGNISDDSTGSFRERANSLNVDPLLGNAGMNGGRTLTVELLPGSPARDSARSAVCPATDQRGVARPDGVGCDVGAVEMELPPGPPLVRTGEADFTMLAGGVVILEGIVDPSGFETTVMFEYGTGIDLGNAGTSGANPARGGETVLEERFSARVGKSA